MTMMVESIARAELMALCQRLGHDPARVSRIIIEPATITVEYLHQIVEGAVERDMIWTGNKSYVVGDDQ